MSANVGFYPTTQLNPYTTTIGSQGTYQSIMSYIYGASTYEFLSTGSYTTTSSTSLYTGISAKFTPANSTNFIITYDIYSGGTNVAVGNGVTLCIDTNPPPAVGSGFPSTAVTIDWGGLPLATYRSQELLISDGIVYGGYNSETAYTISLNIPYYFTWYVVSDTSGSVAGLTVLGMSIKSI